MANWRRLFHGMRRLPLSRHCTIGISNTEWNQHQTFLSFWTRTLTIPAQQRHLSIHSETFLKETVNWCLHLLFKYYPSRSKRHLIRRESFRINLDHKRPLWNVYWAFTFSWAEEGVTSQTFDLVLQLVERKSNRSLDTMNVFLIDVRIDWRIRIRGKRRRCFISDNIR